MRRVLVLSWYMVRDLFRSLAGAVPPILTLSVFQATFYFGGSVDYFASVGGADMMVVCLVTTLLFVSRANRATTYPLLARLSHRAELIAAIALGAFAVSTVICVLFTILAVGLNKVVLTPLQLFTIGPRWAILLTLTIALGCDMGKLVSRAGYYISVIGAVAVLLTIAEQRVFLTGSNQNRLVDLVAAISAPVTTMLTAPVGSFEFVRNVLPMGTTLLYALILFILAASLLRHKDLLWVE